MKQLYTLLLLCLPLLILGQQKFDYTVSEPYKVIDSRYKFYLSAFSMSATSPDNTLVLGIKYLGKKGLSIQYFDAKTMKEKLRNTVSLPDGIYIEHVSWLGNRAYLYYSMWDKPNTTEQLFCQEIDVNTCTLKGAAKRLIAVKGKLTGVPLFYVYGFGFGATNKFSFLHSHDDSKLLVQARRKPVKKNDAINNDIIIMYVFDEEHNELTGNEIKMPYTEQAMDNLDYHLDADGIPYLLARVRSDGSDKDYKGAGQNRTINHHIELLKFDIPAGNIKVNKIAVEGYLLKDLHLYDGPNDNMVCAGFYASIKQGGFWDDADGFFVFDIKNSGSVNHQNFYPIPLEIINQYERQGVQNRNARKEKKGKAQFEDLTLRKLSIQDDNSLILIGEKYYLKEHRTSKGQVYYTYHYEDILITKIASDGQLVWMRKLPKRQMSNLPTGGVGFKYIELKGKHYMIFLDNVKNMSLELNERPAVHQDGLGGFLTAYGVEDATGATNKVSIFDTRNIDGIKIKQFSTYRMLQCSPDEFILETYKGKKEDVMIKIKVE